MTKRKIRELMKREEDIMKENNVTRKLNVI